jgi:O-succinylbenzoic acid--CoA ligase
MAGKLILGGDNYDFSSAARLQKSGQYPEFQAIFDFILDWQSGEPSFELFTSGSTGKPKAITISRNQMIASAKRTSNTLKLGNGISALMCMNPSFIGGKMMLVRAMELDWDLTVISPSNNPAQHLSNDIRFSFMALVPMQLENMIDDEVGNQILHRTEHIIVGGAPVSSSLREKLNFITAKVYNTYGMTETISHIALMPLNGPNASDKFKVLDGIEVGTDAKNCLRIKGDVTNNAWIQTNDVVELRDQHFKWLGRADFVINSGGIKIHLDQLEEQISDILKTEVVLLKIKDALLGESYALVLKEDKKNYSEKIQAALKLTLPKYHSPKVILKVESFLRTESGKIDRLAIKAQLGLD